MGPAFWIRRFATALAIAFVVIAGAQLLKGNDVAYAASEGLLWAVITAAIFTAANYYRWRRGQHCAICDDVEAMTRKRDDLKA